VSSVQCVIVDDGLRLTFRGIPEGMASGCTSLIRNRALWQGLPSTAQRSNDLGQPSGRTDKSSQAASAPLMI